MSEISQILCQKGLAAPFDNPSLRKASGAGIPLGGKITPVVVAAPLNFALAPRSAGQNRAPLRSLRSRSPHVGGLAAFGDGIGGLLYV